MLKLIYFITTTLLCISFFLFGFWASFYMQDISTISSKEQVNTSCDNLSLEETSECVLKYINKIYRYNQTNDWLVLTMAELEERGGDCNNYADLYVGIFKNLGFYAKKAIINIDDESLHAVAIVSGKEGYCVIDQTEHWCAELAK